MGTQNERGIDDPRDEPVSSPWRSAWSALAPRLAQTWLNLRHWIPGLANPDLRGRTVTLWEREAHEAGCWHVELPEKCWNCSETDGLRRRTQEFSIRGFEYPLSIVGMTAGCAVVALGWLYVWPSWFALGTFCAVLAAGSIAIYVKSWPDRAKIGVWSCPRHARDEPLIQLVVEEDQLNLILPTRELARIASDAVRDRRRSRQAYTSGDQPLEPPPAVHEPRSAPSPAVGLHPLPQSYRPTTAELPPIELADGPLEPDEDRPE